MADENEEKKEEEAPDEEKEAAAEQGKKSESKLGVIVVVVVGLLVMTLTPLISWLVVKNIVPPLIVEKKTEEQQNGVETILPLGEIQASIKGTKVTRFIVVEPHLVLSESRLLETLKNMTAMLTDKVLQTLSRRTIDEFEGPEALESLKRDIMSEINSEIEDKMSGVVKNVYFKKFLIQ